MSFLLHVASPVACFPRPEFRRDRISYDVITPMAARGVFEAVHWTPSIRWEILSITVLKPILFEDLAREDPSGTGDRETRPGRCSRLVDVAYLLEGRFELTGHGGEGESVAQHLSMFRRRLRRQRFFRPPFLGFREAQTSVKAIEPSDQRPTSEAFTGRIDLGWMLYDRDPATRESLYFRPAMIDGVIDTTLSSNSAAA